MKNQETFPRNSPYFYDYILNKIRTVKIIRPHRECGFYFEKRLKLTERKDKEKPRRENKRINIEEMRLWRKTIMVLQKNEYEVEHDV